MRHAGALTLVIAGCVRVQALARVEVQHGGEIVVRAGASLDIGVGESLSTESSPLPPTVPPPASPPCELTLGDTTKQCTLGDLTVRCSQWSSTPHTTCQMAEFLIDGNWHRLDSFKAHTVNSGVSSQNDPVTGNWMYGVCYGPEVRMASAFCYAATGGRDEGVIADNNGNLHAATATNYVAICTGSIQPTASGTFVQLGVGFPSGEFWVQSVSQPISMGHPYAQQFDAMIVCNWCPAGTWCAEGASGNPRSGWKLPSAGVPQSGR